MNEIEKLKRKLGRAVQGGSVILSPEQAKAKQNHEFMQEVATLWTLREQVAFAMLQGGMSAEDVTAKADAVGRELAKLRCEEAIKVSGVTDTAHGDNFRFLCALVGAEVPEKEETPAPKLVQAH
jgi:hypothetical protein